MSPNWVTLDGNEACARVACQLSDVIAINPITPSSSKAESAKVQRRIARRTVLYEDMAKHG